MNMGVGFSEILLILALVLVFFGSKELPRFMREGARLMGKLRGYTDKVKRELNDITSSVSEAVPGTFSADQSTEVKKKELRTVYLTARKALSAEERAEKSKVIHDLILKTGAYANAGAILVYVDMGSEVETRPLIRQMLLDGKRVAVPYCKPDSRFMGIAQITDCDKDLIPGEAKNPEPRLEIRDNFFKSDLGLILCPGVAFDHAGGRLGRGKAYFDNFLRELRGRVPMFGLCFECQYMAVDQLPFSYDDIPMDQIVSEAGYKRAAHELYGMPQPPTTQDAPQGAVTEHVE